MMSSLAHPNGKREHNVDFGHHTGTQCFSGEKLSRARATERTDSRCSQAAEQQVRRNWRTAESIPDPSHKKISAPSATGEEMVLVREYLWTSNGCGVPCTRSSDEVSMNHNGEA